MNHWENPRIFRENKEPAHATLMSYPEIANALCDAKSFLQNPEKGMYQESPYYKSLNGDWSFYWINHPSKVPPNFYQSDFIADWKTIPVPSCVELQGYGIPIYSNVNYPFVTDRTMRPDKTDMTNYNLAGHSDPFHMVGNPWIGENGPLPVSLYRQKFDIPESWASREIILHFDGVLSAFYLWINGHYVGYSQDSMTPAEFNITPYLQSGENLLAVQVHKWCDGSYLEDQDMWRLSGIFRDVFLYSRPKIHIADFFVQTDLDSDFRNGMLKVNTTIQKNSALVDDINRRFKILITLFEFQDEKFLEITQMESSPFSVLEKVTTQSLELTVKNPKKWSAEIPNLYHLVLTLIELPMKTQNTNLSHETVLDCVHQEIGFRKIEIRKIFDGPSAGGAQLLFNGQPILIKGVNVHDWDPDSGMTVPIARMLQDFATLKQYNVNAVRTCHYPKTPMWYRLANLYGIYVMDECNLETHGLCQKIPADDDLWRDAAVDRMVNMVARDKNHPCIFMWSLGNEAGIGLSANTVHHSMKNAALALDSTRPIQYENDYRYCLTDTIGNMYASPDWCKFIGEHPKEYPPQNLRMSSWAIHYEKNQAKGEPVPWLYKPLILVEYTNSHGNTGAEFQYYWDIFEKYPNLQGGFVWEFMDKAIRKKDSKLSFSNENESFLYGGDFGDKPYDAMAALGGVFNPDRHPYPSADEMKKAYQELSIIPTIDLGKKEMDFIGFRSYSVKNKHFFRPLNFLQLTWELSENGLLVEQGTLALPAILPRSQSQIDIPFKMHNPNPKSEFYLLLKLTLKEATRWAPAGYLIAFQQIAISNELLLQEYTTKSGTLIKSEESPVYPLACYATKNEFIQKLEIDSSPDSTLITVLGSKFKVTFDTLKGSIVFIEANKIPLFEGIMEPNFIRAFHEDIPMEYGIWMSENQMDRKVKSAHISRDAFDCIRFYAIHQVNDFDELGRGDDFLTEFHHEVRVFGNGEIEVHNWCTPKSRIIRFGMTMPNTIPAKFHRLEWYGRGPIDKNSLGESYPDRVQACPVGRYSSIIDERFCRYSKPQENGGITDVRWLAIMDSQKNGLLLSTNQKLTVSIWSYTQDDLFKAKHLDELPDREKLTLNVDLAHLGFPPSKSLMPQKYEYSFRIKFLNSALGDLHKFSSDENCQSK